MTDAPRKRAGPSEGAHRRGDAAAVEPARRSRGSRARCCSASARPRPSASAARCSSPCSPSIRPPAPNSTTPTIATRRTVSPTCRATIRACPSRAPARPAAARRSRPADRSMPARQRPACRRRGTDPEQQRIAQEQEAARTSHLFATTNVAARLRANAVRRQRGARPPARRSGVERPDLAGSQARLPERHRRPPHRQPRSRPGAREPIRAAGRRRDPGGADHRPALRPSRPGHRPGDRRRL